eukprot:14736192-Ditylum_brightwellii.AAC.1
MHDTVILSSEWVIQWQHLIEEFGPEVKYVKGIKNVVANALSRLRTKTGNLVQNPVQNSPEALEEVLDAKIIDQEQRKLKEPSRNGKNKNKENVKASKVDEYYLIADDGKI